MIEMQSMEFRRHLPLAVAQGNFDRRRLPLRFIAACRAIELRGKLNGTSLRDATQTPLFDSTRLRHEALR